MSEQASWVQVVRGALGPSSNSGFRVPISREFVVVTPESSTGQVFVAKDEKDWVFGLSELQVGREIPSMHFDLGKVAVKRILPQAPLCPTVLSGVDVLPACTKVHFPSLTAESLIQPIRSHSAEFLDFLIEEYKKLCSQASRIGVLISGGWDSRLELACVASAIGKRRLRQIKLLHCCTRPDELRIVKDLSTALGIDLYVRGFQELIELWDPTGQESPNLSVLSNLSTWRPSIPIYSSFVQGAKASNQLDMVIGFAPHSLKGRQYGIKIDRDQPPSKGLFRLIQPRGIGTKSSAAPDNEGLKAQLRTWQTITRISADWDEYAQRDYLLWQLHNGNSYSHRLWPWIGVGTATVNNRPNVIARFMGLPSHEKEGVTFIEFALNRLFGERMHSGIRSSTGEKSINEPSIQRSGVNSGILWSGSSTDDLTFKRVKVFGTAQVGAFSGSLTEFQIDLFRQALVN